MSERTWSVTAPHVIKVLHFIRSKGAVTAEQLVEWDRKHGQKLFTWDDAEAADQWRMFEARQFLNRFSYRFERMKVRAFVSVPGNAEGTRSRAYHPVEVIAEDPEMRASVIRGLRRRMETIARELRFWNLAKHEREDVLSALQQAIGTE